MAAGRFTTAGWLSASCVGEGAQFATAGCDSVADTSLFGGAVSAFCFAGAQLATCDAAPCTDRIIDPEAGGSEVVGAAFTAAVLPSFVVDGRWRDTAFEVC